MSRTPEPRPALRRADDGAVHPAAPRATAPKHLHPAPPAPAAEPVPADVSFRPGDLRARKAGQTKHASKGEKVSLEVRVPKKLRKSLRRQAESENRTVDAIVIDALFGYLDE